MSASPVTIPISPLPRDIDINITINRTSTEGPTDMSLLVFCTPDIENLPPNNGRVIIGSTPESILDALNWLPENSGYFAVQALIGGVLPRPSRMAVGRIFTETVPGQLMAAKITDITVISTIADGSFNVIVTDSTGTPTEISVTGVDLTGSQDVAGIATAINQALTTATITQIAASEAYGGRLVISAVAPMVTISYATAGTSGTDISGLLNLTQVNGAQNWEAYTPGGLVEEVKLIQDALSVLDSPAFCVAIDRQYRDTQAQRDLADYIETSNFKSALALCTNSKTAIDAADTTNIMKYCHTKQYRATNVEYSTYTQEYPEVAYVRRNLSTDYDGVNTVATAKFKEGVGITPENITETQLQVITANRGNVYTRTGRRNFFREGTQSADFWSTMSYFGWANLREYISVSVMNGFIRRDNTPMSREGQGEVVNDVSIPLRQFSTSDDGKYGNGFLADRDESAPTLNVPYVTKKAYTISAAPIFNSNRETGELSPIHVDAYEAGSILKANININAIN